MSQINISQVSKMPESIPEKVKRRRHLDKVRTADHASRFSGTERLLMGLKLSAMAIRVAGDRNNG